ncbi:MAG TPA: NAD-dependent epimerase/dehydratase family protein [Steroidobacteraceae bacterium]|nr:NAD-dependent epimerase/dehydratase family protein [Steroidobacteraceae bacterium]
MKIVVCGANGYIGEALVARLLSDHGLGAGFAPLERLTLVDVALPEGLADPRIVAVRGSIAEASVRAQALEGNPDVFFQMAALPGGVAERDYAAGRAVNVDATFALLHELAKIAPAPRLVFTSSIAVFGVPLPALVDDDTLPVPGLSYGAQKLMAEILLNDLTRRGWVDARIVRLSGILARPNQPSGLISAYLSQFIHALRAGQNFTVPVSPGAPTWVMSKTRCVDNLLHAARLAPEKLPSRRTWTLPALRLTMEQLVDGLAQVAGPQVKQLIRYEPVEAIEAQFGRYPPLHTRLADSLGFQHDGDAVQFMQRVIAAIDA